MVGVVGMKKYVFSLLIVLFLSISLCACATWGHEREMLPEAQNFRVENRVITWDPVENASGYLVSFDGKKYQIEENSFSYHDLKVEGTYTCAVIALGDGEKYDNSVITYYEVTLNPPVEHGFDELGFEYTYMEDLGGYEINAGKADLSGMVVLPDYFGDWPVKRIAGRMFKHELAYTVSSSGGRNIPNCFTEQYCNSITTGIQLPAHLESIGMRALGYIVNLEEIVIPDTVVEIGGGAFEGCKRLKKVVLPSNLKEIPLKCFENTALTEIILPEGLETIGGGAFKTEETEYGHIYSGVSEVTIPASVKEIGNNAFYGRRNLETVILEGDYMELIGASCFHDTAWFASQADGLVYLNDYFLYCCKGELPENARVEIPTGTKCIASNAFGSQKKLCEVIIPEGVEFFGEGIFNKCSSLTSVSLPADIKTIPWIMFSECINLKTIILPEGLTAIDICAFQYSGLESITIPSSVKSIGDSAFARCESLKEISFPIGVEFLGFSVIDGCTALESIFIPASVKKIEAHPFRHCSSLTHVFFEGSSLDEFIKLFNKIDDNVVAELKAEPIYYYSAEKHTEEGLYWHYVDGKPTPWET